MTLVIRDWKSELHINGAILILQMQKYKSTFMPKKGSSYPIWKTSGEQCLRELYSSFSSAPKHTPNCRTHKP